MNESASDGGERSWYTPGELASEIGIGPKALGNRLRRGTLRGDKQAGRWRIPAEVAIAEIAARRAHAVSSGSVRLLRAGEGHPPLDPAPDGSLEAAMLRQLVEAKDQVIAAKDLTIERLNREVAVQRAAIVVLMGGTMAAETQTGPPR